jgi:mxaJ protein
VADKRVDVAVVWGPLAGYFAQRSSKSLVLTPVTPEVDPPSLPFTFSISMGVRKGNTALRDQLDEVLSRQRAKILEILNNYGVPQLELPPQGSGE